MTTTILVVDDEMPNRRLLQRLMESSGYEVLLADNGDEAVRAFTEHQPDLVLMDIRMPVMDGYEATRRIKAVADGSTPVLFVTALTDQRELAKCIECGGDDFVTKPVQSVALRAKIRSWLNNQALLREVAAQRDELRAYRERERQHQELARRIIAGLRDDGWLAANGIDYVELGAQTLGGDFMIAEATHRGTVVLITGDFTGSGVPAALGILPVAYEVHRTLRRGTPPEGVLSALDEQMRRLLPVDMFLALALVEIDTRARRLSVWNAGLPDVMLLDAAGEARAVGSDSPPLGIDRRGGPLPQPRHLAYGDDDTLFIVSDGVSELLDEGAGSGESLVDCLARPWPEARARLQQHAVGATHQDDRTVVRVALGSVGATADVAVPRVETPTPSAEGAGLWQLALTVNGEVLSRGAIQPVMNELIRELEGSDELATTTRMVLDELYNNAVDHGLLELDSSSKSDAAGFEAYYAERARKLAALREGEVMLRARRSVSEDGAPSVSLEIADSGMGFDHASVLAPAPGGETAPHGRGIQLVNSLARVLRYNGPGNRVEVELGEGADLPEGQAEQ